MQKQEFNNNKYSKNFISYKDFDPSKLQELKLLENKYVFNEQEVTALTAPIKYNYGTEENPIYNELVVNCCSLRTGTGIKVSSFNSKNFWMAVELDLNVEEQLQLYNMLQEFYSTIVKLIANIKNNQSFTKKLAPAKVNKMAVTDFIAMQLKSPVVSTYPDDQPQELLEGKHTIFLPLVSYTFNKEKSDPRSAITVKTKFYHPEKDFRTNKIKEISWDKIKGPIEFFPQIRFRRISVGSHWSLQFNCPEAIITRIFEGRQQITSLFPIIEEMNNKDPYVGKKLDEDILRIEKLPVEENETEEKKSSKFPSLPSIEMLKGNDVECNPLLEEFNKQDVTRQNLV